MVDIEDFIKAVKGLTIEQAKITFQQDYGSYDEEDDDRILEQEKLDSYIEGVNDALEIVRRELSNGSN